MCESVTYDEVRTVLLGLSLKVELVDEICEKLFPKRFQPKPGQVIAVRNDISGDWRFDVYRSHHTEGTAAYDKHDYRFLCEHGDWIYARALTPTELGE